MAFFPFAEPTPVPFLRKGEMIIKIRIATDDLDRFERAVEGLLDRAKLETEAQADFFAIGLERLSRIMIEDFHALDPKVSPLGSGECQDCPDK